MGKIWILIILLLTSSSLSSQTSEYEIKAIFLERFTRFITWPEDSGVTDPDLPFRIKVLGDDPFQGLINEIYQDHEILDKKVHVGYIESIFNLGSCELLFISSSERDRIEPIMQSIKNKPVLVVGDTGGYTKKGVHINFKIKEGKIRFDINRKALITSGLKISHLLLQAADQVETGD